MLRSISTVVFIALALGDLACRSKQTAGPGPSPETQARVAELRKLGRHLEASALASGRKDLETVSWELPPLPKSYKEIVDPGDAPLAPGCVCCYEDASCTTVIGRSVDECFPGGVGGDDLSENTAPTTCTQGVGCAARKQYKCSKILPGSVCAVQALDCCGIPTTSAYCKLEL